MQIKPLQRLLIIRRDNIGDLICTTPLVRLLRKYYPDAQIDMLVNSYNYQAVETNPDLNQVFSYTKLKHRASGTSALHALWGRATLLWRLRQTRYDCILVAGQDSAGRGAKLARQLKPKSILTQREFSSSVHAVEQLKPMLLALGIDDVFPAAVCEPKPLLVKTFESKKYPNTHCIAVHISARKVSQRWSAERFIELIKLLCADSRNSVMLFWSPGDGKNPLHPGDDGKANAILSATHGLPVVACPTRQLEELIAALSVCDAMICSDGGAMHVAAALGKPIVCLFGDSNADIWHPWAVTYRLLQKESLQVMDISSDEVLSAYQLLMSR